MAIGPGFAIVGMDCVFPGAANLEAFWRNVCDGVDAIAELPSDRLDPVFCDPSSPRSDRLPCRRGGFIEAPRFDPLAFGIMPVAAEKAEPDQLLALDLALRALLDAGYTRSALPTAGTGVVLGRGNYAGPGRVKLEQHVRMAEQLVHALRDLFPALSEAQLEEVRREFQAKIGAAAGESAIGLVPNLSASRIANRLDLDGPAYTVDAACASALVALDRACQDLETGRADVMLCGAVHLCHEAAFWSVLSELSAISRSGEIRPFDERADGLLVSEGIGMLVVKRLADAERDGDRIYAIVRGTGLSSDGRGATLMNPSVEGQLLALERAWQRAGLDRRDIGLLEAHGTGTPAGDAAEIETLTRFFGGPRSERPRAALGSVKSMIGHAMPAAGAAGLIKAALAVYHGVLPCTLHCEQPRAALAATLFQPQRERAPWPDRDRIAAVNAFGFGGINAHAVLQSAGPATPAVSRAVERLPAVLRIAAHTRDALLAALEVGRGGLEGSHRLAVVDPTPERIRGARKIVELGQALAVRGMFYAPSGLLESGGRLAILHPGFDANFDPSLAGLAAHFALKDVELPTERGIEPQGTAILAANRLISHALRKLRIEPDMIAGQSIGEWSAMIAAGVVSGDEVDAFSRTLSPGSLDLADAVYAAAACDVSAATRLMDGIAELEISHDNCPRQVIVCGSEAAIGEFTRRAREARVMTQRLPFGSGIHSSFFAPHVKSHVDNIRSFTYARPKLPLYSATSAAQYPDDPGAVADLIIAHLVERVRFRELVERLYADGARVFVQVGSGSLIGFVQDTLRERPHFAIAANIRHRSALEQLLHVACGLWVHGGDPDFDALPGSGPARDAGRPLALGTPLVRFDRPLAGSVPLAAGDAPSGPAPRAFMESLQAIRRAQDDVLLAYRRPAVQCARPGPKRLVTRCRLSLDRYPELRDHAFFRQPPGADVRETAPVVPMTGMIELMMQAARAHSPARRVIEVCDVRALHWLEVADGVDVEVTTDFDGEACVDVRLGEYARARVVLGERYPDPGGAGELALRSERSAPIDARQLYDDHWMFHGPAYQGVARLGPIGANGIRGELRGGPALGSLLDSAGQLLAYWVATQSPINRLLTPTAVRRIRFFTDPPAIGSAVEAVAEAEVLEPARVVGTLALRFGSQLWAAIDGWEDRRFATDARLWELIRNPDRKLLSDVVAPGLAVFDDRDRPIGSREYLVGRYLGLGESERYKALPQPARRAWLGHRVASKDAVRSHLAQAGSAPRFPADVEISEDGRSARIRGSGEVFSVTGASAGGAWVALAGAAPARLAVSDAGDPSIASMAETVRYGDYIIGWSLEPS